MNPLPRLRPLELLHLPGEDGQTEIVLRDPEGFSDDELVLSEAALFAAAHFDGEHTVEQTLDAFEERYGRRPDASDIESLRTRFDQACFLENAAFEARAETMVRAFIDAPVRPATHAGLSYPKDPDAAREAVTGFFDAAAKLEEPGERPAGTLRGLVSPHIDLRVGGPCTALAYRLLAEATQVNTVFVLGTAHACPEPGWIVLDKPFETPLGTVPVAESLSRRLQEAGHKDPAAGFYHAREHSIEFQALFLAALGGLGRKIEMVPILCGSLRDQGPPESDAFLDALATVVEEQGERAVLVAGADLAHVGPRFGDPELLSEHHLALLEKKDRATLAHAVAADPRGFFEAVLDAGDPRRICGLSPVYAMLRALPETRGKVLRYEQATDESGTVTYAAVGLWR